MQLRRVTWNPDDDRGIDRRAANGDTRGHEFETNPSRCTPIALLTALLLAACADKSLLVGYEKDENFLSFNHSFTDAAAADVRTRAERLCGLRKQAVIQTSRTCSLTQCTTNYQCIDAADAAKYGR